VSEEVSPKNYRKALAGLEILQGKTTGQALRNAGYSRSVSKVPTANGLSADLCVQAAETVFPEVNVATLVETTRRAVRAKLESLWDKNGQPSQELKKTNLSHLARFTEVIERNYGGNAGNIDDPRAFAGRLEWLVGLQREMQRRNLVATKGESGETAELPPFSKNESGPGGESA
jgi:hypothetical protein